MGERLTKSDVDKIKAEIEDRSVNLRPKLLEDLKEARAQGDLSENFEYYAAKRANNQNNSRIRYLERMLKNATIVSDEPVTEGAVSINDLVTIYSIEDDEEEVIKLVTSIRSDSQNNKISIESPLGSAVRGHKVGDVVTVNVTPDYSYDIEIRKIEPSGDDDDRIAQY